MRINFDGISYCINTLTRNLHDFASTVNVIGLDYWTNQPINVNARHLECWFGHYEMPEPKSVILMIWFNSLAKASHMIVFPKTNIRTQDNMIEFIAFSSTCSKTVI